MPPPRRGTELNLDDSDFTKESVLEFCAVSPGQNTDNDDPINTPTRRKTTPWNNDVVNIFAKQWMSYALALSTAEQGTSYQTNGAQGMQVVRFLFAIL